jgi:hypothetical protein
VSRPHRHRAAVAAGAIAAIAGTVAPGVHRAAADPPGFPSKPGGQPAPQGAAAKASQADDLARERIVALKKFARDNEADPKFAEHEGPARACRIDHGRQLATLTFNADGTLHCKLTELAEGYQIEILVLTVKDVYSTGNHYRVAFAPGAPLKAVPIHGTSDDVKATLAMLAAHLADYSESDWWRAPQLLGPYHFDAGTITIWLDEAAVCQETKLAIAPLYPLNLAVIGLVGPGLSSYSVINGQISESRNRADLGYYFGVHVYPFSWNRNGNRQLRPGRYFSDEYSAWNDRLSLVAGINLSHPTEGGYLGGAIEVYSGVSLTGGWQPRKYRQLQSGHMAGEAITGDVPTDAVWKLDGWGVGLSVDASLLKPLLSFVH